MPTISRKITLLANREDIGPGVKRWRVDGVDALGRGWVHGPFNGTQAEAEVIRDAVVWDLAEVDKVELLTWVQEGNTVAAFDYTDRDITEEEGEEHIFKWFLESLGADAITVSWWLDDINTGKFNAITTRMNIVEHRSDVTSRFTFMVSVEPWYDLTIKVS